MISSNRALEGAKVISEYCKEEMDFEKILKELPLTFNEQEKSDFREYIYSRNDEILKLKKKHY